MENKKYDLEKAKEDCRRHEDALEEAQSCMCGHCHECGFDPAEMKAALDEVERLRSFEEFSKKLITLWIYMADAEEVLQNHRMRILEISQNMIDEQSSKIAAKDARIKEMGAEITAWVADRDSWIARYEAVRKEKDARIADQEAYIERLEAAFLEAETERKFYTTVNGMNSEFDWNGYPECPRYGIHKEWFRQQAREAIERIKEGGKDE